MWLVAKIHFVMSFLEHECNISLAAALAFLDESMGSSGGSSASSAASASSVTPLPPAAPAVVDRGLLLDALDDDLGASSPLFHQALATSTVRADALQLESTTAPVRQETIIAPAAESKQLKNTKKKTKKKLNYDPNKARNERRFELACLRKDVKDLEMTLEQLQSMQDPGKCSTSVKRPTVAALPRPVRPGSGMSAVWEQICAHQLERRLRVERENIHLKMIATSANISMSNEMIENLLVDRALQKQKRG
ncbi:hypothetical protein PHYPSEUDO_002644 [Phytophthora pseudosyringae]|uniref:Uncharacterized protein n=1 Tax=Phytophthora pseudosyringae TaxID=221518 RepID=A0A8T1VWP6_9STRA|nr:hypothetical protein PHYPSEUDO_002644 [Phytophthora pseudosyringae]